MFQQWPYFAERDGSDNGLRGGKRESELHDLQLIGDDPHVAIIQESAKDILATVCLHCSSVSQNEMFLLDKRPAM